MSYYKNKIHHNNTFENISFDNLKSGLALLLITPFSLYGFTDASHNYMGQMLKEGLFSVALIPAILLTSTISINKSEYFFNIFIILLIVIGLLSLAVVIQPFHNNVPLMISLILSISTYLLGTFYFATKISKSKNLNEKDNV